MNKWERELARLELQGEREILERLRQHYAVALDRINAKIIELSKRDDLSGIRQRRYQEMLAEEIGVIMDELGSGSYSSLEEYLIGCYEEAFIGTLYNLQKQDVPLAFPIDQRSMARAVAMTADDVKLSKRVYDNVGKLQDQVIAEITRGFAEGAHATQTAQRIAEETDIAESIKKKVQGRGSQAFRRSMTITRTEKGRVKATSTLEAMYKAKEAGADIVKQWDSTMDSRTRKDHVKADGQIREIDEDFEVGSARGPSPHLMGAAAQDINCRCVCLQRARSALEWDEPSKKWDGVNQCYVDLSDAKSYQEFKSRYVAVVSSGAISGALNNDNDPDFKKREKHAKAYYEAVRKRDKKREVATVAANSGFTVEEVEIVYDHLFVNKHDLESGYSTFDPDYNIAESWRRLREGKDIQEHDLILLRHELHEYSLMMRGMSYSEAHDETNGLYNYTRAVMDFIERQKGG